MALVTPAEFRQQLRTHERVNLIVTGNFPDGIQSYIEKYPKPLDDDAKVLQLIARITSLIKPGKWVLAKANGDCINNRRSTIKHIRYKE